MPREYRRLSQLSVAERAERLRGQVARANARLRAKRAAAGAGEIRIILTPEEAAAFARLREAQRGALHTFARRALLTGARFLANAGHPAGRKPGRLKAPATP